MLVFYEHWTSHELQKLLPAQGFFGFNVNKNLKNPNALNRQPDTGGKLVPRTTNSRIFCSEIHAFSVNLNGDIATYLFQNLGST